MTAEKLHDAISLLPVDLIVQADKKRMAPRPKSLRLQRYAAMAASFAIIAFSGFWCLSHLNQNTKDAAYDLAMMPVAAESPRISAFSEVEEAGDTTQRQDNDAANKKYMSGASMEKAVSVTASFDGSPYPLSGEDKGRILDILSSLPYDPNALCNCIASITITVNEETTYEVNLEEGYVRCSQGQATLTPESRNLLSEIFGISSADANSK